MPKKRKRELRGWGAHSKVKRMRRNEPFNCQSLAASLFSKRKDVLFTGRLYRYVSEPTTKKKCRDLGLTYGMCHMSVFNPVGAYRGMHVFFRSPETSKVNKSELSVLARLSSLGYAVAVCSSAKSADNSLHHYMLGKHASLESTLMASSGGLEIPESGKVKVPKPEPPRKKKGEYLLHSQCVAWLAKLKKNLVIDGQPQGNLHRFQSDSYYTHVGNVVGYAKGCCDLLVWNPSGKYNGFGAEFKVGRNGLMDTQREFIEKLRGFGWYVCVPRTLEEFKEEFERYQSIAEPGDNGSG